jgi:hypothetical protein
MNTIRTLGHTATRLTCLFSLTVLVSASVNADVLRVGSKTINGTLEGYDGRTFQFRNAETGKREEISRTSIKDLKLDKPRKAKIEVMGKSGPASMLMAGYARGQFLLLDKGEKTTIPGMRVKSLELERVSSFGATSTAPVPKPAKQIPTRVINELLARPDLTPSQKDTLTQYEAAKDKYNTFLAESSAMVQAMDTMTGSDRIDALNNLRLRKDAEQPLKQEMASSQQALLAAFPELKHGMPSAPSTKGQNTGTTETLTLTLPKLGEGEILILDTGLFKQLGSLTDNQKQALLDYEATAADYEKLMGGTPTQDEVQSVQERLATTQSALLGAFPNVRVINNAY